MKIIISTFIFLKIYAFDFVNINKNHNVNILNLLYPHQVVILQQIPYAPYSDEIIKEFQDRVINFPFTYQKESLKRNIKTELPFSQFVFKVGFHDLPNSKYYKGFCVQAQNIIYLEPNFSITTFFHELGHCDLGYSHKEDENVSKSGVSKYIMNWKYDPIYYNLSEDEVIDQFFDHRQHSHLNSTDGFQEHALMISQLKSFEEKGK